MMKVRQVCISTLCPWIPTPDSRCGLHTGLQPPASTLPPSPFLSSLHWNYSSFLDLHYKLLTLSLPEMRLLWKVLERQRPQPSNVHICLEIEHESSLFWKLLCAPPCCSLILFFAAPHLFFLWGGRQKKKKSKFPSVASTHSFILCFILQSSLV